MSDHLPDCDDYAFSGAGFHPNCQRICICRQVRRIEQRVERRIDFMLAKANDYGERTGYAAGVQDARDAVAAIPHWDEDSGESLFRACDKDNALAAIEALRGES